jgi:hypothetical protein
MELPPHRTRRPPPLDLPHRSPLAPTRLPPHPPDGPSLPHGRTARLLRRERDERLAHPRRRPRPQNPRPRPRPASLPPLARSRRPRESTRVPQPRQVVGQLDRDARRRVREGNVGVHWRQGEARPAEARTRPAAGAYDPVVECCHRRHLHESPSTPVRPLSLSLRSYWH